MPDKEKISIEELRCIAKDAILSLTDKEFVLFLKLLQEQDESLFLELLKEQEESLCQNY